MLKKIKKWLPTKRKIMQLYFAVLFNANLKGFVTGDLFKGSTKNFCAPGINCYSCPGAVGACPLGSLQGAFSSANHSTLYYVGGILLLYCIIFGRMICGWLCPFGLVQELCYKVKTPKVKKSPVTRIFSYLKYAILVFFVGIVPILYAIRDLPLPAFCKYICPAGTLEGGIGLLSNAANAEYFSMLGPLFTWKFLLMVSTLVGCVFIFRLFCRFICPLGALYGLFNKISIFGIKVDNSKCTHCGLCHAKCKVDIRTPGDAECISCGECVGVCPTKAIEWKGTKIQLAPNEGASPAQAEKTKSKRLICRLITAAVMLAVLIGSIVYFWVTAPDPAPVTPPSPPVTSTEDPDIVYGNQIGNTLYAYELNLVDSTGETGETIDPSKTGKVTVINFWGTWCNPCVTELPHFQQVAEEYGDSIVIVAVHSSDGREEAPAFIAEHYPNSPLLFSWDSLEVNSEYYKLLGGKDAYPFTLVLDGNGVIIKKFVGSVTHDQLVAAIEEAMK